MDIDKNNLDYTPTAMPKEGDIWYFKTEESYFKFTNGKWVEIEDTDR